MVPRGGYQQPTDQIPRKGADIDTCNARESFQSASTETAFTPRSTWLM